MRNQKEQKDTDFHREDRFSRIFWKTIYLYLFDPIQSVSRSYLYKSLPSVKTRVLFYSYSCAGDCL